MSRSGDAWFLVAFGALFALVGGAVAWANAHADPDPIEATPTTSDAQALQALRPGSAVLVEGKVSPSMPVVEEGLALRQRQHVVAEQATGNSSEHRLVWRVLSSDPGPLELALPDATIRVGLAAAQWRAPPRRSVEDGHKVSGQARVVGFAPGDAVTVRGVLTRDPEGLRVEAEELFGGTAEELRQDVRSQRVVLGIVGAVFAAVGAVMMLLGGVVVRRRGKQQGPSP